MDPPPRQAADELFLPLLELGHEECAWLPHWDYGLPQSQAETHPTRMNPGSRAVAVSADAHLATLVQLESIQEEPRLGPTAHFQGLARVRILERRELEDGTRLHGFLPHDPVSLANLPLCAEGVMYVWGGGRSAVYALDLKRIGAHLR